MLPLTAFLDRLSEALTTSNLGTVLSGVDTKGDPRLIMALLI